MRETIGWAGGLDTTLQVRNGGGFNVLVSEEIERSGNL